MNARHAAATLAIRGHELADSLARASRDTSPAAG